MEVRSKAYITVYVNGVKNEMELYGVEEWNVTITSLFIPSKKTYITGWSPGEECQVEEVRESGTSLRKLIEPPLTVKIEWDGKIEERNDVYLIYCIVAISSDRPREGQTTIQYDPCAMLARTDFFGDRCNMEFSFDHYKKRMRLTKVELKANNSISIGEVYPQEPSDCEVDPEADRDDQSDYDSDDST